MKVCTECGVKKALCEFDKSNRATGARSSRGGQGVEAKCKVCKAERRKPGIHAERAAKAAAQAALLAEGKKVCGACGGAKPYQEFHKRAASPDGLAIKCKPCVNAYTETWRKRNPAAYERWYQENRQHKLNYNKQWDGANKELKAGLFARWAKAHPDKMRAKSARRMAAKLKATPAWANEAAIEAIYAEAARLTKLTGERHEVDHIVPLQGRIVRGLHWEGNLQILPKAQNISKHNRYWPDMP